jgi:hypothetical protein
MGLSRCRGILLGGGNGEPETSPGLYPALPAARFASTRPDWELIRLSRILKADVFCASSFAHHHPQRNS